MSSRCECRHYQFAHSPSGRCDDCLCEAFIPACTMCWGSGRVLVAPVTASYADWGHATKMPCPRCVNGAYPTRYPVVGG